MKSMLYRQYFRFSNIHDICKLHFYNQFIMQDQLIQNQISENLQAFTRLINQIGCIEWKKAVSLACSQMSLKKFKLEKLNTQKIKKMYEILIERSHKYQNPKQVWQQNQLRIFIWLIICYSALIKKNLFNFTDDDWKIFQKCFFDKPITQFKFQYNNLKNVSIKIEKWNQEQNQLLVNIIHSFETRYKWSQISKLLFIKSNQRYFKTAKQCRERWNNYLDPNKYKGQWKLQQDLFLIQNIIKFGKKWCIIAKCLQNKRTQHAVKNRYKSLALKQKKQQRIYKTIAELQLLKKIQNRIKKQLHLDLDNEPIQNIKLPEIQNNNFESNNEDSQPQYQIYQNKYDFIDKQINYISIDQDYQKIPKIYQIHQQKKETLLSTYQQYRYSQVILNVQQNVVQQGLDYYELDFLTDKNYNGQQECDY